MWNYAIVELSGDSIVKVETTDGEDFAALRTGKEKGLAAVVNYLDNQGWKLCESARPLDPLQEGHRHLVFLREALDDDHPAPGVYREPPS